MTEQAKFLAHLDGARKGGLKDIKFFIHTSEPTAPEKIFQGLNEIEDAIAAGKVHTHSSWKGDVAA